MLFLATGASSAGKSTVREFVTPGLGAELEALEPRHLGAVDEITVARRQEMAVMHPELWHRCG